MKNELAKLFAVAVSTLLIACGGDDGTGPTPGDGDQEDPASTLRVDRASLAAAVPANGDVVRGEFLLGAIVDAKQAVEVRFLVDGIEVGVVNELPYQISMSACDLTVGNHAYAVMIEDEAGNSDFVEQFFEAKCD